jgi:hypothetical protein
VAGLHSSAISPRTNPRGQAKKMSKNTQAEMAKLLVEIRDELRRSNVYNKELKDIIYLFKNNLENKENNLEKNKIRNTPEKFAVANVSFATAESQNPWTATEGFEQPTDEYLTAKPELEREMWRLRSQLKRNHVQDIEISHLLDKLHTDPASRLAPADLRLLVANWLNKGIQYSAPYYPHQMWENNKRHRVPHWQFNLDRGREVASGGSSKAAISEFDEQRKKTRRSA